ncbi:MAG TPA: alkaline phosphatase family protein, partial [Gemmatales bacterium]|nr:alkaline phosphatase family protein [Gemmatales bacterium]
MMDAGIGYPLYDITSSGLTEASQKWRKLEVNRHRVATMNWGNNFGYINIDWYAADPVIRLQIRDEAGEVTIQQKVLLSTIHPNRVLPQNTGTVAAEAEKTSEGTINTLEAAKKVGEEVTVEFTVKATGGSSGRVFLNSLADFRDPRNFTVVLEKGYLSKAKDIADPREHFKGRKIQVTGKVELFKETAQIKVTEMKQIKVLP